MSQDEPLSNPFKWFQYQLFCANILEEKFSKNKTLMHDMSYNYIDLKWFSQIKQNILNILPKGLKVNILAENVVGAVKDRDNSSLPMVIFLIILRYTCLMTSLIHLVIRP